MAAPPAADIEKALACHVTAGDRTGVGDVEGVLARLQLRTGDPLGAAATYERAIRAVPWSVDRPSCGVTSGAHAVRSDGQGAG